MKGPLFYSKILLFGEYGIIKDSKGLSIPYNFYKGALKKSKNQSEVAKKSSEGLLKFYEKIWTKVCISIPAFHKDMVLEVRVLW
jgi:mevalonate kinase